MNDHESNPGPAVSSQQESDTESKQRVPGGSGWDSIGWYEWWRRRVVNVCLILMIVYIGLLVALVFAEPMLVYPAPKLDAARRQTLRDQGPAAFQPVQFQSRDGIELHGHYLPFEGSDRYILMCHGNGEDRDTGIWHAEEMRQRCRSNVLLFDFRGYGESGGKPNQAGILQDGEAAMDWLVDEKQISPDRVIVYGRSLGGAVAVYLGKHRDPRGLVLSRTFNSMVSVASNKYPIFPVYWLMQNRYPSQQWIAEIKQPILQLHGDADRVVPIQHGYALRDAATSQDYTFVEQPGIGHNSRQSESGWNAIVTFIDRMYADEQLRDPIVP